MTPGEVAEWITEYEANGRPQHNCATESVGNICGVCGRSSDQRVDVDEWEPNPDRPGLLRHVRDRTVAEVYKDLRAIVGEYPYGGEEYFGPDVLSQDGRLWPRGRVVVFSVTGSSEGDYVHVEVVGTEKRELVLLAKTFDGRDASWAFARRLADLLEWH